MVTDFLLSILACPNCVDRPPLRREGDQLVCTVCARSYKIIDGVPQLLPEDGEAQDLSGN